jgi:hypothetical protein
MKFKFNWYPLSTYLLISSPPLLLLLLLSFPPTHHKSGPGPLVELPLASRMLVDPLHLDIQILYLKPSNLDMQSNPLCLLLGHTSPSALFSYS